MPPQAARQGSEVAAAVTISKSGINDTLDALFNSISKALTQHGTCTIHSMTWEVGQPPPKVCAHTGGAAANINRHLGISSPTEANDRSDCEGGTAPVPSQATGQHIEMTTAIATEAMALKVTTQRQAKAQREALGC